MWALSLEGSRQVEKHPQGQPRAHPGRDGVGRAAGAADLRLAHLFMGLPGGVTWHRPPQDQAGGGLQGWGPIRPCPPEMGASGSQPGQRGKPMGQVGCPLGPALPGRPEPASRARPPLAPSGGLPTPAQLHQRTECCVPGGNPGVRVRARAFSLWNRQGSQPAGGSTAPRPKWGQNRAGGT